jgi:hypothetical protein
MAYMPDPSGVNNPTPTACSNTCAQVSQVVWAKRSGTPGSCENAARTTPSTTPWNRHTATSSRRVAGSRWVME